MGFFSNASLLRAYKDQIGEDKDYLYVEHGKGLRDTFSYNELTTLVVPYWEVEQRMLRTSYGAYAHSNSRGGIAVASSLVRTVSNYFSRIWERTFERTFKTSTGNGIRGWIYFTHVSVGIMADVLSKYKPDTIPEQFGQYDIVSAYPSAMLSLWSWVGFKCLLGWRKQRWPYWCHARTFQILSMGYTVQK